MVASGHQNPQASTHAVVLAQVALPIDLDREDSGGDAACVQGVGLADPAIGLGVHARSLNDLVARSADRAGQLSAVGGGALDHPEHLKIAASTTAGPLDGTGHTRGGGRELAVVNDLTMRSRQDRQGVSAGVGVHAHDERMSLRHDGHSGRVLPLRRQRSGRNGRRRPG